MKRLAPLCPRCRPILDTSIFRDATGEFTCHGCMRAVPYSEGATYAPVPVESPQTVMTDRSCLVSTQKEESQ